MKRISFILLLIITMLITSCKKEDIITSPQKSKFENLEIYLKIAGEEHNKGLDFVFNNIKKEIENNNLNLKDSTETIDFTMSNVKTFIVENDNEFIRKNSDMVIHKMYNFIKKWLNDRDDTSYKHFLWLAEFEDSLTDNQKSLLVILENAINNDSLDLDGTLKVFENVRKKVYSECSEEEQFYVLAAIEIGVHSLTYWHDNYTKWFNLFNESNKAPDFSWKEVGKEDIKGAIGGAVAVGVESVVAGPPGWAAGTATVLGCGLGTSAMDAVGQLLDSLW